MLTGRQRGEKLQCLFENPRANNFYSKIEFWITYESLNQKTRQKFLLLNTRVINGHFNGEIVLSP